MVSGETTKIQLYSNVRDVCDCHLGAWFFFVPLVKAINRLRVNIALLQAMESGKAEPPKHDKLFLKYRMATDAYRIGKQVTCYALSSHLAALHDVVNYSFAQLFDIRDDKAIVRAQLIHDLAALHRSHLEAIHAGMIDDLQQSIYAFLLKEPLKDTDEISAESEKILYGDIMELAAVFKKSHPLFYQEVNQLLTGRTKARPSKI